MTSLVLTITETMRYRGAIGQWSWVLHRIAGLGVVFFLILHVIDTSWAVFAPEQYAKAIAAYQTPLFTLGEFALVACVVYHAYNGLRIAIIDFNPKWWQHQRRAAWIVIWATVITLIPTFLLMFRHVLDFYGSGEPYLGVGEVLAEQLPFIVGILVAAIVALFFSAITGAIAGDNKAHAPRRSELERFWWSFMRISGLLIIPLVFGHLAMMHILQGVFDITAQAQVVGTTSVNETATAVEFVADRWNYIVAGVAIWRVYDLFLLILVTIHGFNGLRYVLTDYTTQSRLLRRASVYFVTIGAVILLVVGGAALLNTIPESSIQEAERQTQMLFEELGVTPEGALPAATESSAGG